jgi:hypothetical protein
MNPGYVLFIQACSVFWREPRNRELRLQLLINFSSFQFLGICANMWRFLSPRSREWWVLEASRPVKRATLQQIAIRGLAQRVLDGLKF